ncbi:MAG: hypothetical protein V1779_00350 [bacterium]
MDSKYIYITILFLLAYTSDVKADEVKYIDFTNSFGLKASNMSGYGFYFNKKISEDFNLQAMGLIYYYINKKEDEEFSNFNYDFGLEIQRNMYRTDVSRVYLLTGSYYYYDNEFDKSLSNKTETINHSFNIGVGVGYELYYKRFVLGLELGYKFFEDNKEITENNDPTYPVRNRTTKIGLGIGIGFTF